jgi:hypothetical protein
MCMVASAVGILRLCSCIWSHSWYTDWKLERGWSGSDRSQWLPGQVVGLECSRRQQPWPTKCIAEAAAFPLMVPRLTYNSYSEMQPEGIFIIAAAAKKPLLQGHPSSQLSHLLCAAIASPSQTQCTFFQDCILIRGRSKGTVQLPIGHEPWNRARETGSMWGAVVLYSSVVKSFCMVVARKDGPQGEMDRQ